METTEAKKGIEFICVAVEWRDKVNGNTYHSVRITRCSNRTVICAPFQYGYGDHYQQTALTAMLKAGWLPKGVDKNSIYRFERDNGYPIFWTVRAGTKAECTENGIL